jgi:hypothetical protein
MKGTFDQKEVSLGEELRPPFRPIRRLRPKLDPPPPPAVETRPELVAEERHDQRHMQSALQGQHPPRDRSEIRVNEASVSKAQDLLRPVEKAIRIGFGAQMRYDVVVEQLKGRPGQSRRQPGERAPKLEPTGGDQPVEGPASPACKRVEIAAELQEGGGLSEPRVWRAGEADGVDSPQAGKKEVDEGSRGMEEEVIDLRDDRTGPARARRRCLRNFVFEPVVDQSIGLQECITQKNREAPSGTGVPPVSSAVGVSPGRTPFAMRKCSSEPWTGRRLATKLARS